MGQLHLPVGQGRSDRDVMVGDHRSIDADLNPRQRGIGRVNRAPAWQVHASATNSLNRASLDRESRPQNPPISFTSHHAQPDSGETRSLLPQPP